MVIKATEQAWTDQRTISSLHTQLERCVANYKIFFEELQKFKEEVMDDAERKADLKLVIDIKPGVSMNKITAAYNAHKAIYDYLKELE